MIRLTQYLCPARHCILGVAYDDRDTSREDVQTMILDKMRTAHVDYRCGICGATAFHFEDGTTRFDTIAAAEGALSEAQAKQWLTRMWIDFQRWRNAKNN